MTILQFPFLCIEDLSNSEVKAVFPLREGEEFIIKYTHSVDLLPVYEIYCNKEQHICLRETHFYNFGAGMGLMEGRGTYTEEDGLLKLLDINEKIEPLILRTGKVANHQFLYRKKTIALTTHFGSNTRLGFEIKNLSVYSALINTGRQ